MKCLLACVIAASSWLYASGSNAQAPADSVEFGVNDARVRFRRGVDFYLEGSYDASYAELSKAYEISPNYRVLYNLAQVQTQRHDYVSALKYFDDYLKQGGAKIATDRREQVERALSELKTRVASLYVVGTVRSEVWIDGVSAGTLPMIAPVLINPGVHQLHVRKPGYEPVSHVLTIASAETVRLELPLRADSALARAPAALAPEAAAPREPAYSPPPTAARAQAQSGSNAPLWISLIATAALTGGAVTFGLLAKEADDDLGRSLAQVPADRGDIAELRARVERNAALCDGLTAGAVIGAGLSIYFAISGGSAEKAPVASRVAATMRGIEWRQRF